jgi:flagellar assembly factor FliW
VVPPHVFFPHYAPVVDDATVAALGIRSAADVLALVVVNPGDSPAAATANLLAPVVINTATRQGAQVVLTDDLPVRAPLIG